jgi:predicted 2-oxoglutarate/Fe(II)-dependent dioxygenase YbiX|tara:strand:- start:29 stop:601 length:573 start_codon:yes stop_codon:yes gene_type:complete
MDINNPKRHLYWQFKDLYTPNEIKVLNKKIQNNLLDLKDNAATNVVKTAQVSIFDPFKIKELDRAFESIYKANRHNFGFYLFDSINDKQLPLNYNIYDSKSKGEYKYHTDAEYEHPSSDIKLTSILNLSSGPYTGGKFYINPFGEERIVPEISTPGNMVIFPSWFFHKVTPVTKGKRISITIWSKGPKFR